MILMMMLRIKIGDDIDHDEKLVRSVGRLEHRNKEKSRQPYHVLSRLAGYVGSLVYP